MYTLLASRPGVAAGADHQVIPMLQSELGEAVQVHADNAAVVLLPILGVPKLGMGDLSAFALQRESSPPRGERMLKIRRVSVLHDTARAF